LRVLVSSFLIGAFGGNFWSLVLLYGSISNPYSKNTSGSGVITSVAVFRPIYCVGIFLVEVYMIPFLLYVGIPKLF
jgi:hypothetical protein